MPLLISGALLVAMGLIAGLALVASSLGAAVSADAALWLLFPLLCIVGFVLFVVGARNAHIRHLSQWLSWALLALALASAGGLLLRATSLVASESSTLSLWYVLVVAGLLGTVGAASRAGAAPESA
jgi:hypothetical protein